MFQLLKKWFLKRSNNIFIDKIYFKCSKEFFKRSKPKNKEKLEKFYWQDMMKKKQVKTSFSKIKSISNDPKNSLKDQNQKNLRNTQNFLMAGQHDEE